MRVKDARMVHRLVKRTAEEMAGAFYELQARRDNLFYRAWPNQRLFIHRNWRNFVVTARQVLGTMLGRASTTPEAKVQIYEALTRDGTLPYSIQEAQITNIPH